MKPNQNTARWINDRNNVISLENSNGTCLDDMGCSEMTFSKELCQIADINERCCSSCYHFCQDQLVCKNYPSISSLCETSEDIRKICPKSCGLCGKF